MAYATQADLIDRYGQLEVTRAADRDPPRGTFEPAALQILINKALATASGEIDSYVSVNFDLPLNVIPARLTDLCCDIAIYRLCFDSGTLTEEKRLRYEDAVKWLTNLAKGIVMLGVEEPLETSTNLVEVSLSTPARLFTRNTLRRLI